MTSECALTSDTRLRRVDGLLESQVGDERLMMSVDLGRYFSLNPVASAIWELTAQPRSIAELRDAICAEFDVTPEQCEADIRAFAVRMIQRDLMHVVG